MNGELLNYENISREAGVSVWCPSGYDRKVYLVERKNNPHCQSGFTNLFGIRPACFKVRSA